MAIKSAKSTKSHVVELTVDKDTKNTRKYQADEENDVLPMLYVQKTAWQKMPDHITVTIEPS